jgi:hypothetical protein
MKISWRIGVLGFQLGLLSLVTLLVTGRLFSSDTWYFAGLLAIIINPQLLEPYYPRPADVIANSTIFIMLAMVSQKTLTRIGWVFFGSCLAVAIILSVVALILGTAHRTKRRAGFGIIARSLSQLASARVIYSIVFLLSAIERWPDLNEDFWILTFGWALIIIVGKVNWESLWISSQGTQERCAVESMIGPSILVIRAPSLPDPGTSVSLSGAGINTKGVVISRIRRMTDVWGQIHIKDTGVCESILAGQVLSVSKVPTEGPLFIGSVDAGSTDKYLKFVPTHPLEIGKVVGVPLGNSEQNVLYQISSATIEQTNIKGGSRLVVRVASNQLGVFDRSTLHFKQHRWVPSPGGPVYNAETFPKMDNLRPPDNAQLLGTVLGTDIPIYLDCGSACEGHVAILGMTKMGKSTLATRLAVELAKTRRVTILDQTGEYAGKKGIPASDKGIDWNSPGISVFEPKPGEVPADRALVFFDFLVKKALEEYKSGTPYPRVIIIDEAHQFIPEPTGLGFNAPGRDSSYKIGLLLMQIRKYGISVFLISQRTAVVAKSALSQCENLIAFRSVDQTGLDYLEAIAGGDIRSLLPQLSQGEALVFGPAISADGAIAIQVSK